MDTSAYTSKLTPGVFTGVLDAKKWGKHTNLICFFTLGDGSKIAANVWWRQEYLGLKQAPIGASFTLTFQNNSKGRAFLSQVEGVDNDG